MTIHADWARLLHEECPEAFVSAQDQQMPAGRFDVGVIDGHLQLMCLNSRSFGTWEGFLVGMFLRPIQKLYLAGCSTVVLCFDSYDHVPSYKAMTQQRRVTAAQKQQQRSSGMADEFRPTDELPPQIPEDAMAFLMNRHFKLQVIQLACEQVPRMVMRWLKKTSTEEEGRKEDPLKKRKRGEPPRPKNGCRKKKEALGSRRFILDYRCAVEYIGESALPIRLPELASLGESDIKFVRYVERYGNALVHAIDGDYMIIALLYFAMHGVRDNNRIFLLRQAGAGIADEETGHGKKPPPQRRKCWVDMQLLFHTIAASVRQCLARGVEPLHPQTLLPFADADMVHAVALFMLCAGTDFSRSLPLLGPKRLWEHLTLVAAPLLAAAPVGEAPNLSLLEDSVIGAIYGSVFGNHLLGCPPTLTAVLARLRTAPKLSQRTHAQLPTPEQVRVTLLNVVWVMTYWSTHNAAVATPLDGTYGFVRCPRTAQVVFADTAQSSSSSEEGGSALLSL